MKLSMFVLVIMCLLPLTACDFSDRSLPRDFYSMQKDPPGEPVGTMWLGMTRDEQSAATGVFSDASEVRVRYVDNAFASMTSVTFYIHPIGVTWDMAPDQIKAHYTKDPEVTITEESNLLTATKTIDDVTYYVRVVLYDDGVVKEINITNDPTLDELRFTVR